MAIPAAILQAQRASLFGLGNEIYSGPGLGADLPAYDLNTPGAVQELKRALVALASAESDPFKKSSAHVATEQTWKAIVDDDTWDGPAAEELLLAISRYRGAGVQIGEPYVQQGLQGGPPQPAVNGLELIAGAVRQRLAGVPAMTKYEAWRAQGCLLQATCFAPPSAVSKPPSDTPVTRTFQGLRLVPPTDATPASLATLAAADVTQQTLWQLAMKASTEAERAKLASFMTVARASRDAAAQAAIDSVPGRQGTPVDTTLEVACVQKGGFWDQGQLSCTMPSALPQPGAPPTAQASLAGPLVIVACAALGYWWVTKKKGGR
jgi:hypothetical protein